MGFIKDTFLGGAEKKAARRQVQAGRRGQGFIRDATSGAQGELRSANTSAEEALSQFLNQSVDTQATALQDILSSLQGGTSNAIDTIRGSEGRSIGSLIQGLTGAENKLNPFVDAGNQSLQLQAALSGALGAPAQEQAFNDFISSPGQQFLRDQGEQSISRQASASGGLGGGALKADLQRFGTGLAAQDFQNQFARLGEITGRGQNASTFLANSSLNTGTNIADLIRGNAAGIAGLQQGLGASQANAFGNTANNITNLFNNQGSALASLRSALGSNLAQLLLGQGVNLSNLEQGIGAAQAQGILSSNNILRKQIQQAASAGQSRDDGSVDFGGALKSFFSFGGL